PPPPAPVGPEPGVEQALAAVFAEVLGVASVGALDDFFALGGDSIASLRIVSRARARGIGLVPRDVLEAPTVRGLAARAAKRPAAQAIEGPIPLTAIQRAFLRGGAPAPD